LGIEEASVAVEERVGGVLFDALCDDFEATFVVSVLELF
jgi:hypothetical protein